MESEECGWLVTPKEETNVVVLVMAVVAIGWGLFVGREGVKDRNVEIEWDWDSEDSEVEGR